MFHTKKGDKTLPVVRRGLDSAKSSVQVHGGATPSTVVIRTQLTGGTGLGSFAQLPPGLVGLEAGGGAPCWARELQELGHDVRLRAAALSQP